jgi:tetratricopeptide (TPR) repeat protein
LGLAYALSKRFTEALPLLNQARDNVPAVGGSSGSAVMTRLCEGYLLVGRWEEALELAEQARRSALQQNERGQQAHALHLLGDVAMHGKPPDLSRAEIYYQQSLKLAIELGMRPLQAHCHRGLGTLYRQKGQSEQTRAELSTAIEMYRDMEMTFWLPETEAALADMEGKP